MFTVSFLSQISIKFYLETVRRNIYFFIEFLKYTWREYILETPLKVFKKYLCCTNLIVMNMTVKFFYQYWNLLKSRLENNKIKCVFFLMSVSITTKGLQRSTEIVF